MTPTIVAREAWLEARIRLLARERELTRQRDALALERQALPWVEVRTPYVFQGPDGAQTAERASGSGYYNYRVQAVPEDDLPGYSVFYRDDDGRIFHTYSCYGRGGEAFLSTYAFLDIVPLGRNETGPSSDMRDWVRRHDEYAETRHAGSCCGGV